MWEYSHYDELFHYGVKGMKWGVIRWKDKRARRKLTRQTAAAKKNLKSEGERYSNERSNYDSAANRYESALKKVAFTKRSRLAKQEAVEEARDDLTEAGNRLAKVKSDFDRAERLYDKTSSKLSDHVNRMISEYGEENVKSLKVQDYDIGRHYVKEMVKTGITIANLPIIGTKYTGRYVGENEYEDRIGIINERDNTDKW